jgi:hypothetical protein
VSAVLPGATSVEPIGIDSDHIGMVKFSSAMDEGFRKVSDSIRSMSHDAPAKVAEIWFREQEIRSM